MPSMRATARPPPPSSSAVGIRLSTATPMGIIIKVAAVFDIHMESNAQAIMKPATSRRGDVPVRSMTARAMRPWSCQRCMAAAMKKPPMKRKMTGLA